MKRSQPSLRPRHRYLAIEVSAPREVSLEQLVRALRREVRDLFGDAGAAEMDLRVEEVVPLPAEGLGNSWAGGGLLRTVREHVDRARAAVAVLREIEGRPAVARTLGVSGTIRGARRFWVKVKRGPVN